MKANPAIGYSFRDQFIPSGSYTITFDNTRNSTIQEGSIVGHKPTSRMILTLTSAGAFTSLLYAATGQSTGEKGQSLFGTPYTQFVKAHSEVCHYFPLAPQHTLATRLVAGILQAYGNSTVAPFGEQFHVGGASDLRAFPLRSIGPGSYRSTERYAYIDHTGDFKLEANIEWRFPLARQLSGALFIDVGNVWLLHPDASRPGGEFRWKTLGRDLALGTGLGLRYNLRVLLLRADVGIPLHTPYDTGKRGYYNIPHFTRGLCFHFGIGYPF
jgi:outer membrane protein assembly factor BamA